jgi:tRNA U38,U39,U40 pseudouridine synthase TruA
LTTSATMDGQSENRTTCFGAVFVNIDTNGDRFLYNLVRELRIALECKTKNENAIPQIDNMINHLHKKTQISKIIHTEI